MKAHDLTEVQLCRTHILLLYSGTTSLFQVTTQQTEISPFTLTYCPLLPHFQNRPLLPHRNNGGTSQKSEIIFKNKKS